MAAASYAPLPAAEYFGPPGPPGPPPGLPPGPPSYAQQQQQQSPPPPSQAPSVPPVRPPLQPSGPSVSFAEKPTTAVHLPLAHPSSGIKEAKTAAELALREYITLHQQRYRTDQVGVPDRLREQAGYALDRIRALRREVDDLVAEAEEGRWRRWGVGTIVATFIPAIRAIFRRPAQDRDRGESVYSNDTEYAFRRSRELLARIRRSVVEGGGGRWAGIAAFVFAVLYVFSNEVTLRVARTVGRRLKRLGSRVESGEDVDERDVRVLDGWRWRVLLWS